ncbi:GAF domain-containing protein [Paenarthrobacter sp. Z7-10]|uniref:GAF domain-containing protein n=1 Tax=Paenarthrobacter sp. Z7-10 TaxID=2787635 RepID=UPI002E76BDC2|nr:GAF domain-containing protein [Paenarthrobacter sp. Z7-10]
MEGDSVLRNRAEGIRFVTGADWSEASVGTIAPGTALALGKSVQIAGAEHYNPDVHRWSCTAVPLHDPDSGSVLGVVDITGGQEAVGIHTLSLVEATVAAAEAHLRVQRLQQHTSGPRRAARRTMVFGATFPVIAAAASPTRQSGGGQQPPPAEPKALRQRSPYRDSLQIRRPFPLLRLGGPGAGGPSHPARRRHHRLPFP